MSWQIVLTGFLKRVDSVAVSSFHKESVMRSADRTGGVRTYNGSGAKHSQITGWVMYNGVERTHITVSAHLDHEMVLAQIGDPSPEYTAS